MLLGILADGGWLAGLALLELGFGLTWSRQGLRILRRPQLWIFVLTALAAGPFLFGQPEVLWGPLQLSREGLLIGLKMGVRAFVITLAFSLGLSSLTLSDLIVLFGRLRLPGLGFALGLAMNLLETLHEMATVTSQTIWLRGGLKRPLVALRLFLVTSVANTLRYGDEAVNAAAVRAFQVGRRPRRSLPLRRGDIVLLFVLVAWSAAFAIAGPG